MSETDGKDKKLDPEALVLRARPRAPVRFKRGLLIGSAAAACLAIFGATWLALEGHGFRPVSVGGNVYSAPRKPKPEAVAALPASYDKIKRLGPPLPGDLGPSVVSREQSLGISPTDASIRPDPEDEAARAERMRLAQQARQAREAGVFFRISQTTNPGEGRADSREGSLRDSSDAEPAVASVGDRDGASLGLDPARDPNDQGRKLDVIHAKADRAIYNPHELQKPISPYELLAGTVISASLITGLNSDLPGLVVAQVTENVFDTVTGRILLVPQGSRLIGTYDSVVAFGQSRALVVWQRIIMPDGSSIQIDNLPASDAQGYSGLEDQVDYHTWTLLKGIALSTLLGVGTQVSFGSNNSNLVEAIRQSTQESTNQAGQKIVEKDLNIQPTITVRPGWPLRVVVSHDIVLQAYEG